VKTKQHAIKDKNLSTNATVFKSKQLAVKHGIQVFTRTGFLVLQIYEVWSKHVYLT